MRDNVRTRSLWLLAGLAAALLLSACGDPDLPQNTFAPAGEVADDQKWYFIWVAVPAGVIMVGVLVACVAIPIMFARKKGDPGLPKQVHGNTPLELTWTIIPAFMMMAVGIVTIAGIVDLGRKPADDALRIDVTAQRFSWLFDYPNVQDAEGGALSAPINEMHIPEDREIGLWINSVDVNHSFWIPKLAGKIDAIANHENYMWLSADEPGIYSAQCAEFCGLQHSDMRFIVVVHTQADFEAWLADQGDYEEVPATPEPEEESDEGGEGGGEPESEEQPDQSEEDEEESEEAGESTRAQGD
jgi:cytochrome c oxidase subunit 2